MTPVTGAPTGVIGQVFFSSPDKFTAAFDFKEALHKVTIDLSCAHFWDITAVAMAPVAANHPRSTANKGNHHRDA